MNTPKGNDKKNHEMSQIQTQRTGTCSFFWQDLWPQFLTCPLSFFSWSNGCASRNSSWGDLGNAIETKWSKEEVSELYCSNKHTHNIYLVRNVLTIYPYGLQPSCGCPSMIVPGKMMWVSLLFSLGSTTVASWKRNLRQLLLVASDACCGILTSNFDGWIWA